MSSVKWLCLALLLPFSAVSIYALLDVGYIRIVTDLLPMSAGRQVLFDLVIGMVLIATWMVRDAQRSGRNVWPYLIATLFLGSFGPLAYLLLTPRSEPLAAGDA